jgi:hypothetical protein
MAKPNPWSCLPQVWVHMQLPGYRELPDYSTYQGFPLEELPPIPIALDDACDWLLQNGTPRSRDGLHRQEREFPPLPPATVDEFARQSNLELPRDFHRFMTSPNLQSRVRSCTDCYLDPGERIVETTGFLSGHLIHFLSDSQSCAHWYVHLLSTGACAILESPDLYCYRPENSDWMENPACRLGKIDVAKLEFVYCAPSFSEFLYRFWIENEIWYAVRSEADKRPLNNLELAYTEHYAYKKS